MGDMNIYIIRHAWAGHFGDPGWSDDSQRELSDEGRERFANVVDALCEREFAPSLIATSPYIRCRQTADIVAERVASAGQESDTKPGIEPGIDIVELDALTPGSDLGEIFRWTQEQTVKSIALVGHAPDVGHLTAALLGDSRTMIRFAKGACAAVRVEEDVEYGAGELRWMTTAKMLGC